MSARSMKRRRPAWLFLERLEDRWAPALNYHGGPLLGNVQIEAVYYTPWDTDSTLQAQKTALDSFFPFITNSTYMDLLAPYSANGITISQGSFSGDDANFPTARTTSVTIKGTPYPAIADSQIRTDLSNEINAGSNNLTAPNANTLYFVFTPPGVVVTIGSANSVQNLVAYHDWFHDNTSGQDIVYAVMPYADGKPNAKFFPLNALQTLEEAASHEMAEAITDPKLNGWYDDALGVAGEIGDLSNATWGTLNGYVVQNEFSNATNASATAAGTNFFISSFLNPTEGQFSGPIATFVDTSGSGNLSYAAVNWGDGSYVSVPTTVQRVNSTTFNLLASHTYNAEEGTTFNLSVQLTLADGSQAAGASEVDINDRSGTKHSYREKGPVTLQDPAVVGSALTFSATAGSTFSGPVATFNDPGGAEPTGDYSATIDWGDGSGLTSGTITASGGVFAVGGGHVYNQAGTFSTTITIAHDSAPPITVHGTAKVGGHSGTVIVWSGASGQDLNWSNPDNWVGHVVPGPGDDVLFNDTVRNRDSHVDPAFAGTIGGLILDVSWGANLYVESPLTITGSSTWASGVVYGGVSGLTNIGTLTVTGPNNKYLSGLLINNGTITQVVGGALGLTGDATLLNNGTYDFQADHTGIFISTGNTSTFVNTGTVRKSTVTDPKDRSFLHASYIINGGGRFDVETGRLALGQAQVSSSGMNVLVAAPDAVLDLTDDTAMSYSGVYGNGSGSGHIRLSSNNLSIGVIGATFNFAAGLLEWTGGQILGGALGLTNAGTLTVTGPNNKYLSGVLTNNGTILQGVGPGSLGLNGDATLVNNGIYDFQADHTGIFISTGNTSTFVNTGTVRKSTVTDPTDRSFLHTSYFVNTGGSFDVETGRLALGQAQVASTGISIRVAATDAVLDLTDDTAMSYSGVYGNGSGSGHIRLSSNNLSIGVIGATFNFAAGLLEWTGGQVLAGPVGLINAGFLTVTGPNNKYLSGVLINNGTILQGKGPGSLGLNGDAILLNNGVYDFQADSTGIFISTGNASTFINAGTVQKSVGSDASFLTSAFFLNESSGIVDVQTGTLNLNVGGTSTGNFNTEPGAKLNFTGNTYTLDTGTTLTGAGLTQLTGATVVINGSVGAQNLVVGSTLRLKPTGTLMVAGNYQQSGVLLIEIAGTSPGVSFGQLNIAGSATLGGGLVITLVDPYFPSPGDAFTILTFAARTGNPPSDFGYKQGLAIGNGLRLDPIYGDTSLTLLAVGALPPPGGGATAGPAGKQGGDADRLALLLDAGKVIDHFAVHALARASAMETANAGDIWYSRLSEPDPRYVEDILVILQPPL